MELNDAVDGRAVANFVLDFCSTRGRPVTNLALQKLVFFCHAWRLVALNRALVKHDFEAWKHGPVLQYLYREFKNFEREPIVQRATRLDPVTGQRTIVQYEFDADTRELLTRVVDFYSRLSASDLRNLSHAKGGPWDLVWNHRGPVNPGMKIGNESIKAYYSKASPEFAVQ